LLVASDPTLVEPLQTALTLAGYDMETAASGTAGLVRAGASTFDLIILDTDLEDLPRIPRHRRRRYTGIPILHLGTTETLTASLAELGMAGEDYVAKPLRLAEVLVRMRVLLGHRSTAGTLRYADLVIDEGACRAWRGDRELDLAPAEFRLLRYLLLHCEKVLSKEQIAREVWGATRGDNAIERLVSRLRRKVDAHGAALIRTHRGFGYYFGLASS